MRREYCTLFDRNYFIKGMLLYESLKRHSSADFCLHILALDRWTEERLRELKLSKVEIVPLEVFEEQLRLKEVRESRTWQEYCWTLASQFLEDVLRGFKEVTYLDADLFFFSDPETVFQEIGDRSIAITPHRLIPSKKHLETNGKFNVGWVTIRNTEFGWRCVQRWAAQCRERCSATVGCGDQGYLDEWPELYGDQLCIIKNWGVNVAPWNLANWRVTEGPRIDGLPIVAYHFHEFAELDPPGNYQLTNYDLRWFEDVEFIYKPYVEAYEHAKQQIEAIHLHTC